MKKLTLQIIYLLVASLVAGVLSCWLHPLAPAFYLVEDPMKDDEVLLSEVLTWDVDSYLWIDARVQQHYDKGHIPGATRLSPEDWNEILFNDETLMLKLQEDPRVIVYCGAKACKASRTIADKLRTNVGLSEIFVLKDGWKGWLKHERSDQHQPWSVAKVAMVSAIPVVIGLAAFVFLIPKFRQVEA